MSLLMGVARPGGSLQVDPAQPGPSVNQPPPPGMGGAVGSGSGRLGTGTPGGFIGTVALATPIMATEAIMEAPTRRRIFCLAESCMSVSSVFIAGLLEDKCPKCPRF